MLLPIFDIPLILHSFACHITTTRLCVRWEVEAGERNVGLRLGWMEFAAFERVPLALALALRWTQYLPSRFRRPLVPLDETAPPRSPLPTHERDEQ